MTDQPPPCSPETAAMLYAQLEYLREYQPVIHGIPEEQYAATQEAKNIDAALKAYRDETGVEDIYAQFRQ